MHLLVLAGHAPVVLTVDHGLRRESARDAKRVAAWAKSAGLKAAVLRWQGAKPKSGIEAAARDARYRLMGAWLKKSGIDTLLVGHTRDDQAETFLLRLARGSGLDGLCAMQPHAPWPLAGFETLSLRRPLLDFGRDELRAWLRAQGHAWLEDPMNDDASFDRVKMRRALSVLEEAGISAARIAAAAAHMARARAALEVVTEAVLARASRRTASGFAIDPAALTAAPREVGLRALAALLMAVGGQAYRPRFDALERLFDRLGAGTLGAGATLHGCRIAPWPRSAPDFRPGTLLVEPEKPRKTGKSSAGKARRR